MWNDGSDDDDAVEENAAETSKGRNKFEDRICKKNRMNTRDMIMMKKKR